MGKKKKVEKSIESLEKQVKIHEDKIKAYSGKKDYLVNYWQVEIEARKKQIEEKKKKLL